MGRELLTSGLFSSSQMDALRIHAGDFPAYALNRLFVEYKIRNELELEGYGHGYSLEQFNELIADDPPGLSPSHARSLRETLSEDPFFAERGHYVERRSAGDPEWIEYDWSGERFLDQPAVFFMVPARLQSFSTTQRLAKLAEILPKPGAMPSANPIAGPPLVDVLETIREAMPEANRTNLAIYRIGLSRARHPGWMKTILSGIEVDPFRAALAVHGGIHLDVFAPVVALYSRFGGANQLPIIAASIDSHAGQVQSIDVECPYFNGIRDRVIRQAAVNTFVESLLAADLVPRHVAATLVECACREFQVDDQSTFLTLNHFKFGIAGRTRGRMKVYFELETRATARVV